MSNFIRCSFVFNLASDIWVAEVGIITINLKKPRSREASERIDVQAKRPAQWMIIHGRTMHFWSCFFVLLTHISDMDTIERF